MASLSKCVDLATRFSEEDIDELVQEMVLVREDMDVDDNVAALEAATRIVERSQTVRNAITDKTGPIVSTGTQIRETADGFEAYLDGEKVGRNDPCPCGAKHPDGRPIKYKHCHGKSA